MSQKHKDSANLKGEMTMITRASKLKKVPDAPLDLEDNNPTLVTQVKKMPVLYYVISASDGHMPHFAKSDEEKDEYIEDLDGSYIADKFESLDEAMMHYSNQIQACSLALASKAPAVSPRPKTAGHKIEQHKPCAEPAVSVPLRKNHLPLILPVIYPSRSHLRLKKNILKCFKRVFLQRVRKLLTNTIKLFMFKSVDQKDIVFSLDIQDAKGEVFWQFKPAIFPAVTQSVVDFIPGLKLDVWKSLSVGLAREVPYGGNQSWKNKSGYNVEVVWGIYPFSSHSSDPFAEMEVFGSRLKKLFASEEFQEFYIESVAVLQKNLADLIKCNGKKDLWKTIDKACIDVKEKASLNSFFCDETIIDIMGHFTEGKDPSIWTELERSFAYLNGKIPANVHCI
jgi:hypothetical protein